MSRHSLLFDEAVCVAGENFYPRRCQCFVVGAISFYDLSTSCIVGRMQEVSIIDEMFCFDWFLIDFIAEKKYGLCYYYYYHYYY